MVLTPGQRQTISWIYAWILLIGPLETNFNGVVIKIHKIFVHENALETVVWKMATIFIGLNMLRKVRALVSISRKKGIDYWLMNDCLLWWQSSGYSNFRVVCPHVWSTEWINNVDGCYVSWSHKYWLICLLRFICMIYFARHILLLICVIVFNRFYLSTPSIGWRIRWTAVANIYFL